MSKKIKQHDFVMGYMGVADDMASDMSDGAWFAMLEDAGEMLLQDRKDIKAFHDGNDVAHYYIRHTSTEA